MRRLDFRSSCGRRLSLRGRRDDRAYRLLRFDKLNAARLLPRRCRRGRRRRRRCRSWRRRCGRRRNRFFFGPGNGLRFNLWRWRRFDLGFDFRWRRNLWLFHDRFGMSLNHFDDGFLWRRRSMGLRDFRGWAKFLAQLVRKSILDRVGMRRDRHAHVLQFANDFRIVQVQLTSQLVHPKFWHASLFLSWLLDVGAGSPTPSNPLFYSSLGFSFPVCSLEAGSGTGTGSFENMCSAARRSRSSW